MLQAQTLLEDQIYVLLTTPGGDDSDGVRPPFPQQRIVTVIGMTGGEIRFHCGIHGLGVKGGVRIVGGH